MEDRLTGAQWAALAMTTVCSVCASYLVFGSLAAATPVVSSPTESEPSETTTAAPSDTPIDAAPAAPVKPPTAAPPVTAKPNPKDDCGDGVCVAPENPDRCPTDCPIRS